MQRYIRGNLIPWAEELGFDQPMGIYNKLPSATESTSTYFADLEKLQMETYINIITGKVPVDAFDQFVKDWYARGGQTLEDEASVWYKDFQSK
jgi:putative aldouronate transport system substrate-binding protein